MLSFVLEYGITERAILSFILSISLYLFLGGALINFLRNIGLGQKVSQWGPKDHLSKEGTPTAGGIFIWLFSTISVLLFGDLKNKYLLLSLLTFALFSILGFADDVLKKKSKKRGFTISQKFSLQVFISVLVMFLTYMWIDPSSSIRVPFSNYFIELPNYLYFVLAIFILVGSSNAVNLTDGLDGLAGGHLAVAFSVLLVLSYLAGHYVFANYLEIFFVSGVGEVVVLVSAIIGSLLGFLWYNSYPAQVFMGDSGSLSLGALLGYISIISKTELFLPIYGFLFVLEAVSVMLQVGYFKITGGKRIFRMAPLHHHFELGGLKETKVVARFIILAVILGGLALLGLKVN